MLKLLTYDFYQQMLLVYKTRKTREENIALMEKALETRETRVLCM